MTGAVTSMPVGSSETNDRPFQLRLAAVLIGCGALLRIVSYFFSDNSGGDAGARARLAEQWLQSPKWKVVFDVYPPGHFWLIGLVNIFCRNVLVASRCLSLVLGIASIWVVWRLARELYGERAAALSAAVFSFFSLHIGYSTTSSSEVPYLFFTLLAILLFNLALAEKPARVGYLAASGISLSIGESIRYEAWIVFAALGLALAACVLFASAGSWYDWKQVRAILAFGVTAGAWPGFMMFYSWRVFGNPLQLVTLNRARVMHSLAEDPKPMAAQLAVMPTVLLISLSVIAVVAALYGLYRSCANFRTAAFAAMTVFFATTQFYQVLTHGLMANARYSLSLGVLLAVVSGFGLDRLIARLSAARVAEIVIVLLLMANAATVLALSEIPNPYAERASSLSPRLRFIRRVARVGRYLHEHMGPNDSVLIDNYNVESNVLADAADLPLLRDRHVYLEGLKNNIPAQQYLLTVHPRYLVYADGGVLQSWLKLPSGCDANDDNNKNSDASANYEIDGASFRCTLSAGVYRVYQLTYR